MTPLSTTNSKKRHSIEEHHREDKRVAIRKKGESIRELLQSTTLGDFLKHRPPTQVVCFDLETTVGEALLKLHKYNILSAPLLDEERKEYFGFVDRWDILLKVLGSIDLQHVQIEELAYQLKKVGELIQTETLAALPSLEDGELIYKANEAHSLYELVEYGFSRTHGVKKDVCHRVAVFAFDGMAESSSGFGSSSESATDMYTEPSESREELNADAASNPMDLHSIVSQSDVLRYIERHKHQFEEDLDLSITEWDLLNKSAVCVPADMIAIHAFSAMRAFHVTSVGVVDNRRDGILVANLSASDLRGLRTVDFPLLSLPVLTFLRKKHEAYSKTSPEADAFLENWGLSSDGWTHHSMPTIDALSSESSLKEAIEHVVKNSHHRVYITDELGRPEGIITITDILRCFLDK